MRFREGSTTLTLVLWTPSPGTLPQHWNLSHWQALSTSANHMSEIDHILYLSAAGQPCWSCNYTNIVLYLTQNYTGYSQPCVLQLCHLWAARQLLRPFWPCGVVSSSLQSPCVHVSGLHTRAITGCLITCTSHVLQQDGINPYAPVNAYWQITTQSPQPPHFVTASFILQRVA